MKLVIRYFFRSLRLILTPPVLLLEKLTTPAPLPRSAEQQAKLDQAGEKLALYQFRACPFCVKVRKEMSRLGLKIKTRDAQRPGEYREVLKAGGGRIKVPCLLIQHGDGREEWLYESKAINAWLRERFEMVSVG